MAVATLTRDRQAAVADARLALGVAISSLVALVAFGFVPHAAGIESLPAGLDLVWVLGAVCAVFLAPVAAGLAGWSSLVALWLHGDALLADVRRTHLLTLVVVATYAVVLAAMWGIGAFAWLGD
ncbi:MAG TPA: hypothetical protein PLZ93_14595 [Nocardioides sp.]|uniref:hypothetical protein n=1 Tax=uncultured Nocardioides sp. TaxID=198441 RepID=UPI0026207CBA|nr:hypothetical protein [uncultured Nocardioides sp.]HRD63752.1 hypothetical protein [Nocardioides sp.]HRI96842.1 hypothetical protein [Nocardioides sp.]HRK46901.1 hypothetical protein [Nocardioides sp.]